MQPPDLAMDVFSSLLHSLPLALPASPIYAYLKVNLRPPSSLNTIAESNAVAFVAACRSFYEAETATVFIRICLGEDG